MKPSIVQIQAKYFSGITHLFSAIFQKKVSTDELQKQYFEHPSGVQGAGFLALNHQNEVIAFCGATVCQLKYGNNSALGLQFGDTMTLPQYQGQGLFTKLSKQLEKWAIQQGILIHFAFLNEHSFWAYTKKLNWTIIGRMQRYTIPIKTIPLQKTAEIIPFLHPVWKKYVDWIISKNIHLQQMPSSLAKEKGMHLIHNEHFYSQKSTHYQVFLNYKQSSVWLKFHRGLWVGDLLLHDHSSKIITLLKSLAQKCGIHSLQLQFFEGTENQKMMSTEWSAHPSWQIGGRSFDAHWPIEKLRLVLGDLDTF